jgi:hypothetical protein
MALDFPNTPFVGQLFPTSPAPGQPQFRWDGTAWTSTGVGAVPQFKIVVQKFTLTGTYTPSPGMLSCIIECIGGGGGGGGVAGVAGGQNGGGGGGGGAYSRKYATALQIGASQAVTVGAAGVGGAPGFANGGAGGTSSVGTLCTAPGGGAGTGGNGLSQMGTYGVGGAVGTGDLTVPGGNGQFPLFGSFTSPTLFVSLGQGGNAGGGFGAGGNTAIASSGGANNGASGMGYGGGGSGGNFNNFAGSNAGGGGGTNGIVLITEYCYQ